ncbi:MAG: beta-galactosidase [Armatimonadota bacterium]
MKRLCLFLLFTVFVSYLAINSCSAELRAEVKKTQSGPVLFINGKPTAPAIFFVNYDTPEDLRPLQFSEVETAGRHGVYLVSFGLPGAWTKAGEKPDFTETDYRIEQTLKVNPKALIIFRIGITWPPEWWYNENPDERILYDNGERGIPSVFSEKWKAAATEQIKAIVEHIESKYGDNAIGYHISAFNTGEWFCDRVWNSRLGGYEAPAKEAFRAYLKKKYISDFALQKAWNDSKVTLGTAVVPTPEERSATTAGSFHDPAKEMHLLDYLEFENKTQAETAAYMCKIAKETAPNKLAMVFFGYHFELAPVPKGLQTSGHLALRTLLDSPYVDVICSPVSYLDRDMGGGGYFMSAVDSAQLAGKLWLNEDDTRTHLAGDIANDLPRLKNIEETNAVLTRNFAHLLTRGSALWWMDLYGNGRFRGDEIWQLLGRLNDVYQSAMPDLKPYQPEIAVIVDQRSAFYGDPSPDILGTALAGFRVELYRTGAPLGFYLLDDFTAGKVPPAKMNIFLGTFRLDADQIRAIKEQSAKRKCTNIWMYAPGIVQGNSLSCDFIKDVTGISMKPVTGRSKYITLLKTGEKYPANGKPYVSNFAINDITATPIAKYAYTNEVAVASKTVDGVTNVYCTGLRLPSETLRDLAHSAGVHIYSESNDIVMAGNGFVALSTSSAGKKTLNMPQMYTLEDIVSGEKYGPAKTFEFDMALGECHIWKIIN